MNMNSNQANSATRLLIAAVILYILILDTDIIGNYAVLILLIPVMFCKRISFKLLSMEKIIICFVLYSLIITIINHNRVHDFGNAINLLIEYSIIILSCHFFVNNCNHEKTLNGIRIFGFVIGLFGIIESLTGFPILHYLLTKSYDVQTFGSGFGVYRINSIFGRPIIYGTVLSFFWLIQLLYPCKSKKINIIFHIVFISNILLNRSRSAWIAIIVMGIFLYFKVRTHKINTKYVWYGCGILFLVLLLKVFGIDIIESIINSISNRISGTLEAGTGQIVRIETMLSCIKYWFKEGNILDFIFGAGKNFSNSFMLSHPVIKGEWRWDGCVDNQYFTLVLDVGIIGLLCFLLALVLAIKNISKCKKTDTLKLFSNIALIGISVCIFFYEGFNYPLIFWLYTYILMLIDFSNKNNHHNRNIYREKNAFKNRISVMKRQE